MKVLFAVSNENISESIVKKYQKEYKELISYKNVYYFNAILKEIQKDKMYDRIVISEDLEQFTNTSYEQMDKFIFDRLDSITDETTNTHGKDIEIILICTERRRKRESIFVKLFGIGIYNAIIGNDRSIDEVCRLIYKPRLKKEAKDYYEIDVEEVGYQSENENDVSEVEIQNIIAHYKRLGKNENKFSESFDNIAAQYNDTQLRIICKFLPLNVRAVLEETSLKYQQVMAFNSSVSNAIRTNAKAEIPNGPSETLLKTPNTRPPSSKPIVVPTAMKANTFKTNNVQPNNVQPAMQSRPQRNVEPMIQENKITTPERAVLEQNSFPGLDENYNDSENNIKQVNPQQIIENESQAKIEEQIKDLQNSFNEEPRKGRGRPRKNSPVEVEESPKRGRGRPKKMIDGGDLTNLETVSPVEPDFPIPEEPKTVETVILPGFDDLEEDTQNKNVGPTIMPGFYDEEDEEEEYIPQVYNSNSDIHESNAQHNEPQHNEPKFEPVEFEPVEFNRPQEQLETRPFEDTNTFSKEPETNISQISSRVVQEDSNYKEDEFSDILTPDKKVAIFVGTSKNGTSFIVNNIAEAISSRGINVAILDVTKNKNSYYIYTRNEEKLRQIAYYSIENLVQGHAEGIKVNNNLTVYTSLPDVDQGIDNSYSILKTLIENHQVILIDSDYDSPLSYFQRTQEMYLIQSMDILTIQPLTVFLKKLKSKNILKEEKIRIVINKYTRIRGVNEKAIIGGMSSYKDPSMSSMTELFNRNTVPYTVIPFDSEIYARYLEGIIECDISLNGYSKTFLQSLRQLETMLYPAAGKTKPIKNIAAKVNGGFSPSMENTLNQMKNNF